MAEPCSALLRATAGTFTPGEEEAQWLVDDLVNDRLIIVIERCNGEVDYRLLGTIERELELSGTYADLSFRFWSGGVIDRAELLEGSVIYKPFEGPA